MTLEFRLVDGVEFSSQASGVLTAAWRAPALHYSPEYVHWQLSFPGPGPAPAAAAFDGARPVGFAGSTHRRLRRGPHFADVLVVSFVAVDPTRRNQGIAASLYRVLLAAIRELSVPAITFAEHGSAGAEAIRRAYPASGFALQPLGEYPVFGCLYAGSSAASEWTVVSAGEAAPALRCAIELCAKDETSLWNDPTDAQLEHYARDPRGRRLLVRHAPDGAVSAVWALPVTFVSAGGIQSVTTLESVWVRREVPNELSGAGLAAAELWPAGDGSRPVVVHAPSLAGFDPAALRRIGYRRVGAQFQGYVALAPDDTRFNGATGLNLEVV